MSVVILTIFVIVVAIQPQTTQPRIGKIYFQQASYSSFNNMTWKRGISVDFVSVNNGWDGVPQPNGWWISSITINGQNQILIDPYYRYPDSLFFNYNWVAGQSYTITAIIGDCANTPRVTSTVTVIAP
jgi:hypothetical protein